MTKTQKETVKDYVLKHFRALVKQHGSADKVPLQNARELKNKIVPHVKKDLGDKYYHVGPKLLHSWSYEVSKKFFDGKIQISYVGYHYNVKRPVLLDPTAENNGGESDCHNCQQKAFEFQQLKSQHNKTLTELESVRKALSAALEKNEQLQQLQQNLFFSFVGMHGTNEQHNPKKRKFDQQDEQPWKRQRTQEDHDSTTFPSPVFSPISPSAPCIMQFTPSSCVAGSKMQVQLLVNNVNSRECVVRIENSNDTSPYCVEEKTIMLSNHFSGFTTSFTIDANCAGILSLTIREKNSRMFSSPAFISVFDAPPSESKPFSGDLANDLQNGIVDLSDDLQLHQLFDGREFEHAC